MDTVFRSPRTNQTRNHRAPSAVTREREVIAIRSAEYVEGYMLRLAFSDGTTREVDFAPFLTQSTNPLIRQYLDMEKFKNFNVTHGDLEWNDYDLCFPVADLYDNQLIHPRHSKIKNPAPKTRSTISPAKRLRQTTTKRHLQKASIV